MKKFVFLIGSLILFFSFHFLTYKVGTYYWDEGRETYQILRVCKGEMPYKDFQTVYGPLSYYYHAFLFKIFSPSVDILRISNIIACGGILVLLVLVGKRIMPFSYALFSSLMATSIFQFPVHTYQTIYSALLGVGSVFLAIRFYESKKKIYLFLSAFLASLEFLIRYFTGFITFFMILMFFVFKKFRLKHLLFFVLTFIFLPMLTYLYFLQLIGLRGLFYVFIPAYYFKLWSKPILPSLINLIPQNFSINEIREAYYSFFLLGLVFLSYLLLLKKKKIF